MLYGIKYGPRKGAEELLSSAELKNGIEGIYFKSFYQAQRAKKILNKSSKYKFEIYYANKAETELAHKSQIVCLAEEYFELINQKLNFIRQHKNTQIQKEM